MIAIGIDLGGTNLKAAAVDRSGRALARETLDAVGMDPDTALSEMVSLVDGLLRSLSLSRSDLAGVGVGAPGPLSHRTGRIIRCANLPGWVDVPIRDYLHDQLGVCVTLDNDGNAAAFGEFWAGTGGEGGDLVMLTLGTGVGAGVILDGRILHGHFENAAELGHMIVASDGLPCTCGQRGCLEQYVSADAVARRVITAINGGERSALTDAVEEIAHVDAERVVEFAKSGDPLCLRVLDEACLYLAIACINIQHAFNPARVVIGGGMSRAGAFLLDRVNQYARERTWSQHGDLPRIELAQLGYDAGVIGAAGLAWQAADTP